MCVTCEHPVESLRIVRATGPGERAFVLTATCHGRSSVVRLKERDMENRVFVLFDLETVDP